MMARYVRIIFLFNILLFFTVLPSYAFDLSTLEEVKNRLIDVSGEKIREIKVVENDYPNAWLYKDKRIVITTGLLNLLEDTDELAFIIAHEMGHTKDLTRAEKRFTIFGVIQGDLSVIEERGLEREIKADLIAVDYLHRAGYKLSAALNVLNKMASHGVARRMEVLRGYIFYIEDSR